MEKENSRNYHEIFGVPNRIFPMVEATNKLLLAIDTTASSRLRALAEDINTLANKYLTAEAPKAKAADLPSTKVSDVPGLGPPFNPAQIKYLNDLFGPKAVTGFGFVPGYATTSSTPTPKYTTQTNPCRKFFHPQGEGHDANGAY